MHPYVLEMNFNTSLNINDHNHTTIGGLLEGAMDLSKTTSDGLCTSHKPHGSNVICE